MDPAIPNAPVLDVQGMRTVFRTRDGETVAIEEIDLTVPAGRTLALVGESGSGKSVASLSVMGLLPHGIGRMTHGRVLFAPPGQPADSISAYRLMPTGRLPVSSFNFPNFNFSEFQRVSFWA